MLGISCTNCMASLSLVPSLLSDSGCRNIADTTCPKAFRQRCHDTQEPPNKLPAKACQCGSIYDCVRGLRWAGPPSEVQLDLEMPPIADAGKLQIIPLLSRGVHCMISAAWPTAGPSLVGTSNSGKQLRRDQPEGGGAAAGKCQKAACHVGFSIHAHSMQTDFGCSPWKYLSLT